jgi:hypothetical protein
VDRDAPSSSLHYQHGKPERDQQTAEDFAFVALETFETRLFEAEQREPRQQHHSSERCNGEASRTHQEPRPAEFRAGHEHQQEAFARRE